MEFVYAILMGVLQGLTEFLPISSSGHLVLAESFWPEFKAPGVFFEVLLHVGTLAAILIYYRSDLGRLRLSLRPGAIKEPPADLTGKEVEGWRRMLLLVGVSTVVTVCAVWPARDFVKSLFLQPSAVGYSLLFTGVFLFASDRVRGADRTLADMKIIDAVLVGLAQALAVTPGISRSGATIAMALFLRVEAETAARFSFFAAIPVIILAAIHELVATPELSGRQAAFYLLGAVVAMAVGVVAIKFLIAILRRRNLRYFSYYCWAIGILSLLFLG